MLDLTPDKLRGRWFDFARGLNLPDATGENGGRITVYEPPDPDALYVAGGDFAHGMAEGDQAVLQVLNAATKPPRQVCEVAGKWGEDRFDRVIYPVLMYYGQRTRWEETFLLGERQGGGLAVLRRLLEAYEYEWLYHERDRKKANKPMSDRLGWASQGAADESVHTLRLALVDRSVVFRSRQLIEQARNVIWSRRQGAIGNERDPDERVKLKLLTGGSPDLVRAAAYAVQALEEVQHYPRERKIKPGTYEEIIPEPGAQGEDEWEEA